MNQGRRTALGRCWLPDRNLNEPDTRQPATRDRWRRNRHKPRAARIRHDREWPGARVMQFDGAGMRRLMRDQHGAGVPKPEISTGPAP
ncbi:hypothetical protein VU09_29300 [Burkholderia pseudomallei]|nr:hypothetical protein VU09_29300 [Burkholderia pseudomallei]